MKKIIFTLIITGLLLAQPIMAQTVTPGINATTRRQNLITNLISRSDTAITQRITDLNTAISRVQAVKKLSDSQKSSLVNSDQTVINNLTSLKTKIDGDTDLATLRTDARQITQNNRVYMLVLPQTRLLTAADRISDAVTSLNEMSTKLQTRITQAQQAGHDVTALQTSLTDLQAKAVDANTQSINIFSGVSNLMPDQGNQATIASNNQALQTARTAVKTADQDLKTAMTDARNIVTGLEAMK